MNKIVVAGLGLIMLLSACGSSQKKSLTESSMHAKADSLVGTKIEELNKQAMTDLDHRMAIEVKAKADSIVNARTGKTDTTRKPVIPPSKKILPTIFHKK